VQEVEDQSCIHVAFGACEQTNVVVRRMNKGDSCELDYWCLFGGLGCYDLVAKVHNFIAAITKQNFVSLQLHTMLSDLSYLVSSRNFRLIRMSPFWLHIIIALAIFFVLCLLDLKIVDKLLLRTN